MTVKHLIERYEQLRPFLIKLGLSPSQIAYKRENIENANHKEITDTVHWLDAFAKIRIGNYNEARGLVSEERWQYYETVCPDAGTYEQQQLAEATEALKLDWKNRPALLKKVKEPVKGGKKKKKKHATTNEA